MCLNRQRLSPLPSISINLSDIICASFLLGIEVNWISNIIRKTQKVKARYFYACWLKLFLFHLLDCGYRDTSCSLKTVLNSQLLTKPYKSNLLHITEHPQEA